MYHLQNHILLLQLFGPTLTLLQDKPESRLQQDCSTSLHNSLLTRYDLSQVRTCPGVMFKLIEVAGGHG